MKVSFQAFLFCVVFILGLAAVNADSILEAFFYAVAMVGTGGYLALNMSGAGNSDEPN